MPISTALKTFALSLSAALAIYVIYQFISLRTQNYLTDVPRSDCMVVLGAAVWPGGQPSPALRDRIDRAAELYRQGVSDKVICSGGVGHNPPAEALVCKQILVKAGVAEEDVIMESDTHSTAEQAVRIKEVCDREGFKSIALVTSFYHEKRATQLFRGAGFTEIADARCTHERFEDLNFWVGREALALAYVNWWHWAAAGLVAGALALWLQSERRKRGSRVV